MSYWPFWISGFALAAVMLFHWFSLQRMMAVSGRISALIDRMRHGTVEPATEFTQAELLAAIQSATAAEFSSSDPPDSECAFEDSPSETAPASSASASYVSPQFTRVRTSSEHLLFLSGLVLGGFVAVGVTDWHGDFALRSVLFAQLTSGSVGISTGLLLLGGICVGFGTRMAGGCTSGHGLCGTSRLQPGSLLATVSFFGAGIGTSVALGYFL